MKASELRIGNLFIEEHSDKIIEVIGLEKNRIIFSGMFLDKWQAKPIALTEEWFLKLGFHKYKGDNSDCFLNDFETSCNRELFFWKGTYIKNIKYVHQLQNLYFALTGEELIINN